MMKLGAHELFGYLWYELQLGRISKSKPQLPSMYRASGPDVEVFSTPCTDWGRPLDPRVLICTSH
jgi:hypothetical protein